MFVLQCCIYRSWKTWQRMCKWWLCWRFILNWSLNRFWVGTGWTTFPPPLPGMTSATSSKQTGHMLVLIAFDHCYIHSTVQIKMELHRSLRERRLYLPYFFVISCNISMVNLTYGWFLSIFAPILWRQARPTIIVFRRNTIKLFLFFNPCTENVQCCQHNILLSVYHIPSSATTVCWRYYDIHHALPSGLRNVTTTWVTSVWSGEIYSCKCCEHTWEWSSVLFVQWL